MYSSIIRCLYKIFIKYDDCNDKLKATYNKSLPEKSTSNICIKVNVLNKSTNEIIKH